MSANPLRCIVCGSAAAPYFRKRFDGNGLGEVEYWRCAACGLVMSKTHLELSPAAWAELNARYHAGFFGSDENTDDPRWMERLEAQRRLIGRLRAAGALPDQRPWLDWGCGDGKLADSLAADGMPTRKFDRFLAAPGHLAAAQLQPAGFDLVLNTSVLEHVTDRGPLDEIAALVAPGGVLALHTLVRGEIPPDPDWFYLLPVHTVFYTNRAMQILCAQWGVRGSLYSVPARMWLLYRELGPAWEAAVAACDGVSLIAEPGFVAYWP